MPTDRSRESGRRPPDGDAVLPPWLSSSSPTRTQVRRLRLWAWWGSALWLLAGYIVFRPRHDGVLSLVSMRLELLSWVMAAGVLFALTRSAGSRGLGAPVLLLRSAVMATPIVFGVTALSVLWAREAELWAMGSARPFAMCFLCTALLCSVPLALWSYAFRHGFVTGSVLRGAALGGACGLLGVLGITLHCSVDAGGHILAAHGMPLILALLAGARLGKTRLRA